MERQDLGFLNRDIFLSLGIVPFLLLSNFFSYFGFILVFIFEVLKAAVRRPWMVSATRGRDRPPNWHNRGACWVWRCTLNKDEGECDWMWPLGDRRRRGNSEILLFDFILAWSWLLSPSLSYPPSPCEFCGRGWGVGRSPETCEPSSTKTGQWFKRKMTQGYDLCHAAQGFRESSFLKAQPL